MIIVSDTSPITSLAAIGQLTLLRRLYTTIHVPEGVIAELSAGDGHWPGAHDVRAASWIEQHTVRDTRLVTSLTRDLGRGESEGIALSLELQADRLLIDEKAGRHAAQRMGVPVLGVLGVLLQAKTAGLIPVVAPHLQALRTQAGFYLTDAVVATVLQTADEDPASR